MSVVPQSCDTHSAVVHLGCSVVLNACAHLCIRQSDDCLMVMYLLGIRTQGSCHMHGISLIWRKSKSLWKGHIWTLAGLFQMFEWTDPQPRTCLYFNKDSAWGHDQHCFEYVSCPVTQLPMSEVISGRVASESGSSEAGTAFLVWLVSPNCWGPRNTETGKGEICPFLLPLGELEHSLSFTSAPDSQFVPRLDHSIHLPGVSHGFSFHDTWTNSS